MKNLFSIVFILIILLNAMGYYGIFLGMQYQNDVAMVKNLDSNRYDESQAISIKIPMAVPYMNDDEDFVRVDGMFEYNGEFYRLVKQKYANDTLNVICLRDPANKMIRNALTDYVKTFTDKPSDQQQNTKLTLTFIKDYIPETFAIKTVSDGWQSNVTNGTASATFIPSFVTSVIHPPERG